VKLCRHILGDQTKDAAHAPFKVCAV
jgi:hypothetical protein